MTSYAVIWRSDNEQDVAVAGRLDVGEMTVSLHGGRRGMERRLEIPVNQLACVRLTSETIGPLKSLAIDSGCAGTVLVAPFGGGLLRGEVLERLQLLVA